MIQTIAPRQLGELTGRNAAVDLIDVRIPVQYHDCHALGARNVPFEQLDPATVMRERNAAANDPVYFICQIGKLAESACQKLEAAGYANVVNVEGGTRAWQESGLPVVHGCRGISLQRQVQMIAGSCILVGSVLGWAVHSWFLALPIMMGAGLLFAGITNTCGMTMLLAKLPWNRAKPQQEPTCSPT